MPRRKFMTFISVLGFIFPAIIFPAETNLAVESSSQTELVLKWNLGDLKIEEITNQTEKFHYIYFSQSRMTGEPGKPQIPLKEFYIAVPPEAIVSGSVSEIRYKRMAGFRPLPANPMGRDKFGISVNDATIDQENYNFRPTALIEFSEIQYFRDLPVVRVRFYPVSYDDNQQQLEMIQSAMVRIQFRNGSSGGSGTIRRSALDQIYREKVINFEQGKQWLRVNPRVLRKSSDVPSGPWFRMEVLQDGIYKISRNTLIQAGIDLAALDPRTIRIFNHGGNPLEIQTGLTPIADLGPQENAILVSGQEDGRFDENDYVLFYGSGPGGWSFDSNRNDFQLY